MIPLPFAWNKQKIDNLILSCHHNFNHGLFRGIKIDLTRQKPKYATKIDDLFGEWCCLFVWVVNSESSNPDVDNYLQAFVKLFPDIYNFGKLLTKEWTKPYKMSVDTVSKCEQMTIILNEICILLEDEN
jgi:hypothetical protein